jgi:hypothetical protein
MIDGILNEKKYDLKEDKVPIVKNLSQFLKLASTDNNISQVLQGIVK